MTPTSLHVSANGTTHHVLEWPASAPQRSTALLIHGFLDAAGNWDLVAPILSASGVRVLAPDLRGFGDGARVSEGGYYHFPDYVFDLVDLVDALVPAGEPILVVGHSMGGTVATLYAGTCPARVSKLIVLEGLGPPAVDPIETPRRFRAWIETVHAVRRAPERTMPTRAEALRRLETHHPRVDRATLATRIDALIRTTDDGRIVWKADPLHKTRAPVPFLAPAFRSFAGEVACPVLFVSGGPLGWHPPDEEARLASFQSLETIELADAGHMMHWTRPADLARHVLAFALPA